MPTFSSACPRSQARAQPTQRRPQVPFFRHFFVIRAGIKT
jgi:hypothetical protein